MAGVWEEGRRWLNYGKREADGWSIGRGKAMAELWVTGKAMAGYVKRGTFYATASSLKSMLDCRKGSA